MNHKIFPFFILLVLGICGFVNRLCLMETGTSQEKNGRNKNVQLHPVLGADNKACRENTIPVQVGNSYPSIMYVDL